ncbi:hypothetical protein DdX_16374 [Ditylenchus destructor]|uniref:Uncharacterized protein n=1 Tax=Ditylenchus destructor TaxID=166010 RepID=A0AAD4MR37_9BILA|nr:hypothetical protein DdX_16374 [Ditylenchus destructor]
MYLSTFDPRCSSGRVIAPSNDSSRRAKLKTIGSGNFEAAMAKLSWIFFLKSTIIGLKVNPGAYGLPEVNLGVYGQSQFYLGVYGLTQVYLGVYGQSQFYLGVYGLSQVYLGRDSRPPYLAGVRVVGPDFGVVRLSSPRAAK